MNRDGSRQELAGGRPQRQDAARLTVAQGGSGETLRSPALALSGHHCVPIAMVTHEYFIRCAIHKNSVRIGQPRRRTLDISPGLLIFFESPRKNINAVDMLRGGID